MKFLEGFLEHKGQESKWKLLWCVLRDRTLYIFTSKETNRENHIGRLSITSDTLFTVGKNNPEQFRFDLKTSKYFNKFRTKRFSERELWRGFITGIATGKVPGDLDLMPGQIQRIEDDIQIFHRNPDIVKLPRPPSIGSGSVQSGFSKPEEDIEEVFPDYEVDMATYNNGGPVMKHRFWRDVNIKEMPSWFFPECTRELAEKILERSGNYGNTLMRESYTHRQNGSYSISKRETAGRNPISHFEVMRVQNGYKINAENSHETFICLSDVMEHFVRMSGAAATKPFRTNNYKLLGLDTPDYNTRIVELNNENGEMIPYDDTIRQAGHMTLPSKAFGARERNRPVGHTVGGFRDIGNRPGLGMVHQNVETAGALHNLDSAISSHDPYVPSNYYNVGSSSGPGSAQYHPEYLPPLQPADPKDKYVPKQTRSRSEPFIHGPIQTGLNTGLNTAVPISQNPAIVKRTNNLSEVRPRLSESVPSATEYLDSDENPYKRPKDPYRSPYQPPAPPAPPATGSYYQNYGPNSQDPEEVPQMRRRLRSESALPGLGAVRTSGNMSSIDQLYQNLPEDKGTSGRPKSGRLSTGSNDSIQLGDIQNQLAKLKPTGKSLVENTASSVTMETGAKSQPPVAPKATGMDKTELKKRLELVLGGGAPPPLKSPEPKKPNVPNIPLPEIPVTNEEIYEYIEETSE